MGVEIERKFKVKELPSDLQNYEYHVIEQGYLNITPAIRVRREDDTYYMTYKSGKNLSDDHDDIIGKTEYNLPLDKASYDHLIAKADGNIIRKKRYILPINKDAFSQNAGQTSGKASNGPINILAGTLLKIELDVFEAPYEGTIIAEVEFPSEEAAKAYKPASWFGEDVTGDVRYSNAHMSAQEI